MPAWAPTWDEILILWEAVKSNILSFWGGILGLVFTAIWIFWEKAPMKRVFLTFFVFIFFMSLVLVWVDEYRDHKHDQILYQTARRVWDAGMKDLQSKLTKREAELKEQPRVIYRDRTSKGSPPAPPTINSLFVEARAVCSLRDPLKVPGTITRMGGVDLNSFFDGPIGKAYLQAIDKVTFQRTEEEGKASTILRYDLPSNSGLTGQPVSSLSSYDYMRISLWALDYDKFTRCGFVEITLRINGKDVFRETITTLPPIAPGTNQYINFPTKAMKVSQ